MPNALVSILGWLKDTISALASHIQQPSNAASCAAKGWHLPLAKKD
jgi:hypothetical protein